MISLFPFFIISNSFKSYLISFIRHLNIKFQFIICLTSFITLIITISKKRVDYVEIGLGVKLKEVTRKARSKELGCRTEDEDGNK